MKKILLTSVMLLLCVGMMLTMAACGLKNDADPTLSTHWVTEPEEYPGCAADPTVTTDETDVPTEETVTDTTEYEANVEETVEETQPVEEEPSASEEPDLPPEEIPAE